MSVQLVNISKTFKDHDNSNREFTAVDQVNIEIKEGEMVTFLGPSGCGKTTTLRIISGFEIQSEGDVFIDGELVNDIPANKRNTSMVFQSYAIFPHLNVSQNIGFGLELRRQSKETIRREVEDIMETMGLSSLSKRKPSQLSGGQQQRVALARAIINKPRVLLFDEPLSNLDAKLRESMRSEIRRIQKQFGITSIYVTHDQVEAMTVSDRIMVMDKGKIQQIGTPFEIYSRPENYFVADFIGRANFFKATIEKVTPEGILTKEFPEAGLFPSYHPDLRKGQSARIVVRPEGITVTRSSLGHTSIEGVIEEASYLGSHVEYEIAVKTMDRPVTVISYNPVKEGYFPTASSVGLSFDPLSAHLIPDSP